MMSKVPTGPRHNPTDVDFQKAKYGSIDFQKCPIRNSPPLYSSLIRGKETTRHRPEVRKASLDKNCANRWIDKNRKNYAKENVLSFKTAVSCTRQSERNACDTSDEFSALRVEDDESTNMNKCVHEGTRKFHISSSASPNRRHVETTSNEDAAGERMTVKRCREEKTKVESPCATQRCRHSTGSPSPPTCNGSSIDSMPNAITKNNSIDTSSSQCNGISMAEEFVTSSPDMMEHSNNENDNAMSKSLSTSFSPSSFHFQQSSPTEQIMCESGSDTSPSTSEMAKKTIVSSSAANQNPTDYVLDSDDLPSGHCFFNDCATTPLDETYASPSNSSYGNATQISIACARPNSLLPRPGNSLRKQNALRSKRHSSRTNLYIRGLPKSMSENDLVSLVPDASSIRSVKLVVNNDGEGYGFIDFVSNEAALQAMQHIKSHNSSQYVNFAYESEKDPLNVYVTNIPESWNSDNVEHLKQIFAPYGKITSALVMTRRSTNTCTGTGFVRYLTSDEAQKAIDGIRKAKITLPGAKRPLELKLADRQRAREHKSESSIGAASSLPLFHQFINEEKHLGRSKCPSNQNTPHDQSNQHATSQQIHSVSDIFSDCTGRLFVNNASAAAAAAAAALHPLDHLSMLPVKLTSDLDSKFFPTGCTSTYATAGLHLPPSKYLSPGSADTAAILARDQFCDVTVASPNAGHPLVGTGPDPGAVRNAAVAAAAAAGSTQPTLSLFQVPGLTTTTAVYPLSCIPWIQDPFMSATSAQPGLVNTQAIHSSNSGHSSGVHSKQPSGGHSVTPATAGTLDLATMAYNCGIGPQNMVCNQLPVEFVLPFLGQMNAQTFDANLYPYGLNQPLWAKACFYG